MKKLVAKLRKSLCLMLSFLLITSSIPAFADEPIPSEVEFITSSEMLIKDMEELGELSSKISELEESLAILKDNLERPQDFIDKVVSQASRSVYNVVHENNMRFHRAMKLYFDIKGTYNLRVSEANRIIKNGATSELVSKYVGGGVLESLSEKDIEDYDELRSDCYSYTLGVEHKNDHFSERCRSVSSFIKDKLLKQEKQKMEDFFDDEIYIDRSVSSEEYKKLQNKKYFGVSEEKGCKDWVVVYAEEEPIKRAKRGIEYLEAEVEIMKKNLRLAEQAKAEILKQVCEPADVFQIVFSKYLTQQQMDNLKVRYLGLDPDVPLEELVKSVRTYLTTYPTKYKDVKYFPEAFLIREMTSQNRYMNNGFKNDKVIAAKNRSVYLDELIDSDKTINKFMQGVDHLDYFPQNYVKKNITLGYWPLVAVASIITAGSIMQVQASNSSNGAATPLSDLSTIRKKIDNCEASLEEQYLFFSNPTSQELIMKDALYAFRFAELAAGAAEMENILDSLKDAETKQIQKRIEDNIIRQCEQRLTQTDLESQINL